MDILLDIYPNAKFVYIERDEATQVASITKALHAFNGEFGVIPYLHNADRDAQATRDLVVAEWGRVKHFIPAERLVQVSYQELVDDPRATVQKVRDALDI